MNTVIALYVTAQRYLTTVTDRLTDDEGQTTMEWMGIAAIVVAILAVLLGNASDLGDMVQGAFERLFGEATNS